MSVHLFKSMNGAKVDFEEPTPDDLARDLALDMIERIKERRADAKAKEINCEESVEWLKQDEEAYATLEALIGTPDKPGRHRRVVLFELFKAFPELVAKMKVN